MIDHNYQLDYAISISNEIKNWLVEQGGVERVEIVGDMRRTKPVVTVVELLASAQKQTEVLDLFASCHFVDQLTLKKNCSIEVLSVSGLRIILYVVKPTWFAPMFLYLTGSKGHWEKLQEIAWEGGLELTDSALKVSRGDIILVANEEEIYHRIGLPFIPPELRDNIGEIEAALGGRLPAFITNSKQ